MTTPKAAIKTILDTLDITKEENWTEDGAPALDVVQKLANDETITRGQINDANPGFVRQVGEPDAKKTTTVAPRAKEPTVEQVSKFTEDKMREVLDRRINDAQDNLRLAQKALSDAQQEVFRCEKRLTRAHEDHGRQYPPVTAAQAIKDHLAAQGRQAMLRAGVDPDRVVGSPIDEALSRSNRRGAGQARPTRPIMDGRLVLAKTA